MATESLDLVRDFLELHNLVVRVWLSPGATSLKADGLLRALPQGAEVLHVAQGAPPPSVGPAILLLTADELTGPDRKPLLDLATVAWPGRPVICGGTRDKDVLLDAINAWRVFHLLPAKPSIDELADALIRAHRASALEHAANECADQLKQECSKLRAVLEELGVTRDKLLHAERVTTVGGFHRALGARLLQHLEGLQALGRALASLPVDPRRNELLEFTVQSIRSIEILLADLLAKAARADPGDNGTSSAHAQGDERGSPP